MTARIMFGLFWALWAISWVVAARFASPAVARPASRDVSLYRIASGLGAALIASQILDALRGPALWRVSPGIAAVLALLTLPGFALAWWARLHLGRLWSAAVTRKPGHRVVDTGPYAWVRHPIYTGLLEAALVSAVAGGTAVSAAGFAVLLFGMWVKARLEERFLMGELGADAYGSYQTRVPMLLPWRLPRS